MNQGISTLHGPHQVAQKLSSTTLPLRSESLTFAPVASLSAKSGAERRSLAGFTAVLTLDDPQPARPNPSAASPSTASFFTGALPRLLYSHRIPFAVAKPALEPRLPPASRPRG